MATRAPLRTYSSKRKHHDSVDSTLKRRRVLDLGCEDESESTLSSDSPSDFPLDLQYSGVAIFSDENIPPSTPPSSPPVLATSPARKPTKEDSTHSTTKENVSSKRVAKKGRSLVQMQLNFGQSVQRRCRDCGMEYVPSVPEDAALHKKFHIQHTGGVVMDKDFLKKAEHSKALWRGPPGVFIMSLDGSQDPKAWLKKARIIFDLATADLGAVDIPDEQLWGLSGTKTGTRRESEMKRSNIPKDGKYKLYLYMDGGKCVGLCLAEHIKKAYKVMEPDEKKGGDVSDISKSQQPESNASLVVSEETEDAQIGISRIWTSRSARKKGIAMALLDCVEDSFRQGIATPRHMVAFSQPTEMGTGLARRWFGKRSGWHVYVD